MSTRTPWILSLAAMVFLSGCERAGELVVVLDSNLSRDGLEVLLVPVDPAPLLATNTPRTSSAQADSLRALAALEDSAAKLDEEFTELREQLNKEAAALAPMDRRSADYARKYDEFRPRAGRAESLRSARDRARTKAAAMRRALVALLPDSARIQELSREGRQRLASARDGGRATRSSKIAANPHSLRAVEGLWWVGVGYNGMAPATFQKVTVAAGQRDTVHIKARYK